MILVLCVFYVRKSEQYIILFPLWNGQIWPQEPPGGEHSDGRLPWRGTALRQEAHRVPQSALHSVHLHPGKNQCYISNINSEMTELIYFPGLYSISAFFSEATRICRNIFLASQIEQKWSVNYLHAVINAGILRIWQYFCDRGYVKSIGLDTSNSQPSPPGAQARRFQRKRLFPRSPRQAVSSHIFQSRRICRARTSRPCEHYAELLQKKKKMRMQTESLLKSKINFSTTAFVVKSYVF